MDGVALLPGAEPFEADGVGPRGAVGVLFVHGFTGSPQSLRPWAQEVAAQGYTVRLPLLPGHGRTWRHLAATDWTDWAGAAEAEFLRLRSRCERVVVVGLSMGGALALRVAQRHPDAVDGLIVVNPSVLTTDRRMVFLPVLRVVRRSVPAIAGDIRLAGASELAYERVPLAGVAALRRMWATVRADLPKVTAPLLLARSAHDRVVPAASCAAVLAEVSSVRREEVVLPDSGHVAPLDHDAATLMAHSLRFLAEVADRPRDEAAAQSGGGR
ncbi:MAG: alpha/beta fold hydrolase [Kineosporiaceae bacterium]